MRICEPDQIESAREICCNDAHDEIRLLARLLVALRLRLVQRRRVGWHSFESVRIPRRHCFHISDVSDRNQLLGRCQFQAGHAESADRVGDDDECLANDCQLDRGDLGADIVVDVGVVVRSVVDGLDRVGRFAGGTEHRKRPDADRNFGRRRLIRSVCHFGCRDSSFCQVEAIAIVDAAAAGRRQQTVGGARSIEHIRRRQRGTTAERKRQQCNDSHAHTRVRGVCGRNSESMNETAFDAQLAEAVVNIFVDE